MLLSVIIVNYNVKYFLEQCLFSLKAALTNVDAEVLVVDNCSADGSIKYLEPLFPQFTFIQNEINEGFARANNKALQRAQGEFILFLNPDTILAEDTLQQCILFFKQHADAGAAGVRMIDGSGAFLPESKRAFPSPLISFYKLTGLASLFPTSAIFNRYALGYLPQHEVHEVDVLAGAFMMIRRSALTTVGGFDERFFMYAEDIDLSYRIQKLGYKNYYLGNITIIHFKGESTIKGSLRYVRMFYKAMRLFVKKHYSGPGRWLLNSSLYAGIMFRQMIAALVVPFYKKNNADATVFRSICLAGDALQAERMIQIAKRMYPNATVNFIVNVGELQFNGVRNKVLVFCINNNLTYKTAIQLTQAISATLIMWCGKNSRSAAGSNNKERSGYVWY